MGADWTIVVIFAVLYWAFGLLSAAYLTNPIRSAKIRTKMKKEMNHNKRAA